MAKVKYFCKIFIKFIYKNCNIFKNTVEYCKIIIGRIMG